MSPPINANSQINPKENTDVLPTSDIEDTQSDLSSLSLSESANAEDNTASLEPIKTVENHKVEIATLVFLDLETTGLAKSVGKKNVHITEISMIAVGRNEFCKCMYPDLRDVRIMHKLSLCIKPKCSVSREASCITGLTNRNLHDQGTFDENTATLITSFLAHLKKPVCILAHNGKLFDFPLLKAEFEKLNTQLPSDVYIVDTLVGFRKFGMPELPLNQKLHKDVKFKLNGNISYALQNLHLYFFGKLHIGSHSSEGDCIALAKVCHKVRDMIIPWIDENCSNFDSIASLW